MTTPIPKEGKKWMITPPKNPITTEEELIMGKLACGCTCESCLKAYKELIENKEYVKQLKLSLHEEKMAMTETISIIEEEENKNNQIVFDLKTEIKNLTKKVNLLEYTMDVESKHRLSEKYKKEELIQLDQSSKEEIDFMRKAMIQMQQDLDVLNQENEKNVYKLQYEEQKNKILLNKMQQYEHQISDYESLNTDLRFKLTQQFDNQIANSIGSSNTSTSLSKNKYGVHKKNSNSSSSSNSNLLEFPVSSNHYNKNSNIGSSSNSNHTTHSNNIGINHFGHTPSSSGSSSDLFASRIPTSNITNILAQQHSQDFNSNPSRVPRQFGNKEKKGSGIGSGSSINNTNSTAASSSSSSSRYSSNMSISHDDSMQVLVKAHQQWRHRK